MLVLKAVSLLLLATCASGQFGPYELVSNFLDATLSIALQQRPNNQNGTASQFREFAFSDQSNEELTVSTTAQQIIVRSGYKYKNYYVLSDDGYISQLIRIINPLADRRRLRQPPVMMFHGGILDPTVYVWASAIQHHPERWPRVEGDGPITSWNRSLAFVLANNGYDVWLVGTRGSNRQNQGRKFKGPNSPQVAPTVAKTSDNTDLSAAVDLTGYWNFTMDNIVQFELPRQVDKVLEVTGAEKVSLVVLSFSTQLSLAFLASRPDYARKVHSYVCMAPIINNKGANTLIATFHRTLCTRLPDRVGTLIFTDVLLTTHVRQLIVGLARSRKIRYSIVKLLYTSLTGPSAMYQTLLEPAVLGHLLQPTGFMEIKHYCQQVIAGSLQKFDYGPIKNSLVYRQLAPPKYNISQIQFGSWLVVSGGNDNLATPSSTLQVIRDVGIEPVEHIKVERYNHLDLVAGFEVDTKVNLPILRYLDRFSLEPLNEDALNSATSNNMVDGDIDWEKFIPREQPDTN